MKAAWKKRGVTRYCRQNLLKTKWRECGGSQICKLNRQKAACRECGGSQICKHTRRKARCKECGGNAFCKHDRRKDKCKDCNDCPCTIEGCPLYGHRFAGAHALMQHMRSRHSGEPKALTKEKEMPL